MHHCEAATKVEQLDPLEVVFFPREGGGRRVIATKRGQGGRKGGGGGRQGWGGRSGEGVGRGRKCHGTVRMGRGERWEKELKVKKGWGRSM